MGTYIGSDWTDDEGRIYRRIHAQISGRAAAERHDAGVPILLGLEQTLASDELAAHLLARVCTEQEVARNRRRTRRGQAISGCCVVELWQSADGTELMMALEDGSPRNEALKYDVAGKGHMQDEPLFDG